MRCVGEMLVVMTFTSSKQTYSDLNQGAWNFMNTTMNCCVMKLWSNPLSQVAPFFLQIYT